MSAQGSTRNSGLSGRHEQSTPHDPLQRLSDSGSILINFTPVMEACFTGTGLGVMRCTLSGGSPLAFHWDGNIGFTYPGSGMLQSPRMLAGIIPLSLSSKLNWTDTIRISGDSCLLFREICMREDMGNCRYNQLFCGKGDCRSRSGNAEDCCTICSAGDRPGQY